MKLELTFARGKFIVIYGINNLGKTTQAKLLAERIINYSKAFPLFSPRHRALHLKYPLYDLRPTGPLINEYLRGGNPHGFSPREIQLIYIQNRMAYQKELIRTLTEIVPRHVGTNVVAEDYTGTGIAWGVGAGVSKDLLVELNRDLLEPDIAFLLDGRRFTNATEKDHTHESNNKLTEIVRLVHLELAREFGWHVIDANRPVEEIHEDIWARVQPLLHQ